MVRWTDEATSGGVAHIDGTAIVDTDPDTRGAFARGVDVGVIVQAMRDHPEGGTVIAPENRGPLMVQTGDAMRRPVTAEPHPDPEHEGLFLFTFGVDSALRREWEGS